MNLILSILINDVLSHPKHKEIFYPKNDVSDLESLGFREDIGEPVGQNADFRITLTDGKSIHAREYDKHIGLHWDMVDPSIDWFEHLRCDSPFYYSLFLGAIGAGIGTTATVSSKNKDLIIKSAILGGLLGIFFGLFTSE